ncbi:hypothetical protein [Aquabacterium sp.]|uniref:hypothetical protein n=1 Tax=Aquabacterium sp. TaxID=1872578 RepID=UPI002CBC3DBF|nr:hypothetical protein [Aquabacterium sp.]HSW08678.1 hypothetical protein [Aquabacterium sp.]
MSRIVSVLIWTVVKHIRPILLILLALLLPFRGAVAAAMLCSPASVGQAASSHEHARHHAQAHVDAGHQVHADAGHQAHAGAGFQADAAALAAHDKCNVCAAFCSLTPILGSPPVMAVPPGLCAAVFPAWSAPPPSFISDGQERPPRSR